MTAMPNEGDTTIPPILEVDSLNVRFPLRRGILGRGPRFFDAVTNVSFNIAPGETLGLVGESGSGKTTIGRAILRLVRPTDGAVRVDGVDVSTAKGPALRRMRSDVQVVFQDPYSSLNPSLTVGSALTESLQQHRDLSADEARNEATKLLEQVGLNRSHLDRYPQQFSGGQRQRIAIARALAPNPRLLVCDEPVSALDVSTQAQVVNLLGDLQHDLGLALLFVAHDLTVVRHLSNRIAVMYLGRLVEIGPAARVYDKPVHPYTKALLASVPDPNPIRQRARRSEREAVANSSTAAGIRRDLPGCSFQTRCPHVMEVCRTEVPPMASTIGGVEVACHLVDPNYVPEF